LEPAAIEKLTSPLEYTGNETMVQMSTGFLHPPISLLVCEYLPPDEKFLLVSDLTQDSNNNTRTFATVRTLQYALRNYSVEHLKRKCQDHIEAISSLQNIIGNPEKLSVKVLRATCRFQEAENIGKRACIPPSSGIRNKKLIMRQHNLLGKAIMINRIRYVMGRTICFSDASVSEAVANLQHMSTNPPSLSFLSARVLTRQIKGTLDRLLEDLTKELLDDFTWELKQKRTETWPVCLCTLLVLCLIAEEVQMAVNGFVPFKISKGDTGDSELIRQYGIEVCRRLETQILEHCWVLLTGKLKGMLKKHNPFRHGYTTDDKFVQTQAQRNLIDDLRQVLSDHGNCSYVILRHPLMWYRK
jgi:hypothetical protein